MRVSIIAFCSYPILTGPSFTSYQRALFLQKEGHQVTLYYPFLEDVEEQLSYYRRQYTEDELREQILEFFNDPVPVIFFPAANLRFAYRNSFYIVPYGDIMDTLDGSKEDLIIVEEPEHLFQYVLLNLRRFKCRTIGILHTNYYSISYDNIVRPYTIEKNFDLRTKITPKDVIQEVIEKKKNETPKKLKEKTFVMDSLILYEPGYYTRIIVYLFFLVLSQIICFYLCDACIAISPSLNVYRKSKVAYIHGITDVHYELQRYHYADNKIYYMGQINAVFKNLYYLLDMANENDLQIDVFGTGPDLHAIQTRDVNHRLNFLGSIENKRKLRDYKIFFNPSLNEGLCTTTAEAIVMGKFVIIPVHPSNEGFYQFKNVLTYRNREEVAKALKYARENQPVEEDQEKLSVFRWNIASKNLLPFLTAK